MSQTVTNAFISYKLLPRTIKKKKNSPVSGLDLKGDCELCVERRVHSLRSKSKACYTGNKFRQGHRLVEVKSRKVQHLSASQMYMWHVEKYMNAWASHGEHGTAGRGQHRGWHGRGVSCVRLLIDCSWVNQECKVVVMWADDPSHYRMYISPHTGLLLVRLFFFK